MEKCNNNYRVSECRKPFATLVFYVLQEDKRIGGMNCHLLHQLKPTTTHFGYEKVHYKTKAHPGIPLPITALIP
jgi:hypothetical protein